MRNIKNVEINRAIIHIMDTSLEEPILNEQELYLDDEIIDFINGHILKSTSDEEAKCAVFKEGDGEIKKHIESIITNNDLFLEKSKEIALSFFNYMKGNCDIPSGDLIICLFDCELGKTLGVMKLDYNKTYIHNIDYIENKMIINIMPQMIGLPGKGQRLSKCSFVNFSGGDYEILLLDRQSKKNGREDYETSFCNWLSSLIIKDKRTITKDIINTSEKWIRENIKEDADKAERARNIITKAIKSEDVINIETVAHHAFENNEELKREYIDSIRDAGIEELEVPVDREWAENKLKRKKLKVDSDIEIYINSNAYEDNGRFEIKRNGDGTINIVIKHVRNYIERP